MSHTVPTSTNVCVSVETPSESIIREIKYDGTEIYEPPLTLSESLSRLAKKIDFSRVLDGTDSTETNDSKNLTEKKPIVENLPSSILSQPSSQWEDIAKKIRNAATEVCVLVDVLTVASAKDLKYMVLDPIRNPPATDIYEQKPMASIYAKKKALCQASALLSSGADRLKATHAESNRFRSMDFHVELLRLRQNWRLKKVGDTITGDLSYKTAGSKFPQSGIFEVTKTEIEPDAALTSPTASALKVTVPTELQGTAYIMVLCQKPKKVLGWAKFTMYDTVANNVVSAPAVPESWQPKLEAAQNVLFCKELFSRLAKETVNLSSDLPHIVLTNQIVVTVLPGVQLIIALCHSTGKEASSANLSPQRKPNHDHVLEHTLHQLLREQHHNNTHHPLPHPCTAPLGPSIQRYMAGPAATPLNQLLEMSNKPTLIEQVIDQARHYLLRLRVELILDKFVINIKDPSITCHWNDVNGERESSVQIIITSEGYDAQFKTCQLWLIQSHNIKCINKDGSVAIISYEPADIKQYLHSQIAQHNITGVGILAKCMGWKVLSMCTQLGIGPIELSGNAASCLISSPKADRLLSIKCVPGMDNSVSMSFSPQKDFFCSQLIRDRRWEYLPGKFKEIAYDHILGSSFLNKIELLMASLTNCT